MPAIQEKPIEPVVELDDTSYQYEQSEAWRRLVAHIPQADRREWLSPKETQPSPD